MRERWWDTHEWPSQLRSCFKCPRAESAVAWEGGWPGHILEEIHSYSISFVLDFVVVAALLQGKSNKQPMRQILLALSQRFSNLLLQRLSRLPSACLQPTVDVRERVRCRLWAGQVFLLWLTLWKNFWRALGNLTIWHAGQSNAEETAYTVPQCACKP